MHIAVALALAVPALCVEGQTLGGRVLDGRTRRPVGQVRVSGEWSKSDSIFAITAQTDSSGEFYLTFPNPGEFRIKLDVTGFASIDGGSVALKDGEFRQQLFALDLRDRAYFDFEVEKKVAPRPGNRGPTYPPELRDRNMSGEVLVQFVVGTDGRAELKTLRIIRSTHALFSEAVTEALRTFRFYSAEIAGKPVRQLVQEPFNFTITY